MIWKKRYKSDATVLKNSNDQDDRNGGKEKNETHDREQRVEMNGRNEKCYFTIHCNFAEDCH